MQTKLLLIVCDGLGDRPVNGVTPLEIANKPNMDTIASEGICGIMDTVRAGIRPGSDTSHLSLFGYDPFKYYKGRGAFEASGTGLKLQKGDVAFRCNFATIKNGRVIDRRAGRIEDGLDEIANDINTIKLKNIEIIFKRGAGHRGVLVFRGKGLSHNVSDVDPENENVPYNICKPLDNSIDARKTAKLVNEFTKETIDILSKHPVNREREGKGKLPANIILCRGAGIKVDMPSFEEKYGMSAACISATTLIKGVCRDVGMDIIDVKGITGHVDSNIANKADAAIKALKRYDFVFLHIKGTDEASHDGDFDSKKSMIERIDKEVIGRILKHLKDTKDITIVLTADHSTPLSIKQHSADPVPIAILGDVRADDVKRFTERDCAKGGLNRICGINLMDIIMDLSNRSKLFGA